jgi:hypothetical protein
MFQTIIQKYHREGQQREITIKAPIPGTLMDPIAIQSLIHHANDRDAGCVMMIYLQTPIGMWEESFNNTDYLHQRYPSEGWPREIAIKRRPLHHLQRFRYSLLSMNKSTDKRMGRDGFLRNHTDTGDGLRGVQHKETRGDGFLSTSAKCKSVRKPHATLPVTPVDLMGAPK